MAFEQQQQVIDDIKSRNEAQLKVHYFIINLSSLIFIFLGGGRRKVRRFKSGQSISGDAHHGTVWPFRQLVVSRGT